MRPHLSKMPSVPRWPGWSRVVPLLAISVLLLLSAVLQRGNDGLWYQGDSPRHFMNGVFWGDFARQFDPLGAREFALEYYKSYPAIAPTIWPPFVYFVEALAFAVTGPSVAVAQGIILAFALMGGIYLVLLLELWNVRPSARWVVVWAVAQPVYLLWTHAVMMEIPALALGIASCFHLHRSQDEPGHRHIALAAFFFWACTLTRLVGILVPAAYWLALASTGSCRRLLRPQHLVTWAVACLALVPWLAINMKYGSIMVKEAALLGEHSRGSLANWIYYPRAMGRSFSWPFLAATAAACWVAARSSANQRAARVALLGTAAVLVALSLVSLKETRYVIGVFPFLAIALGVGVDSAIAALRAHRAAGVGVAVASSVLALVMVATLEVPRITQMEAAVDALLRSLPTDRVLYDGYYDGVFVSYVRTHAREVGVVRGSKVFYATALQARFGLVENATDGESLVAIVGDVGCRWLVLEREEVTGIAAARLVRAVIPDHPRFRWVASYPLSTHRLPEVTALDVFEYRGELGDELGKWLSFPSMEP